MAQPPAYNRTKDFTVDFNNETDHTALNAEFDSASNSINDIRENLAILQADDGKLRPAVVTAESISSAVYDGIIAQMAGQDISQEVLSRAENYANIAEQAQEDATAQADIAKEKAGEVESALMTLFDAIYPIGSIFKSYVNKPPKYGTWSLIGNGNGGFVLLSAGGGYKAGNWYGSNTRVINKDNLPSHSHAISETEAGNHTHNRGSMEISGTFRGDDSMRTDLSGAFYEKQSVALDFDSKEKGAGFLVGFQASKSWTGSTSSNGKHRHTITCSDVGGNVAFNVMQNSVAVYFFRRTA